MNTKFFLLLLVSLLLTSSTSSLVVSRNDENNASEQISMIEKTKKTNEPIDIPAPKLPSETHKAHHEDKSPLQPEDGKHHHFHFTRFHRARRKELKCLLCKIILIFGHVCCFLYCIFHAFH